MPVVKLLISHRANVNLPNRTGSTPIATAAWHGNISIYTFLNLKRSINSIFHYHLGYEQIVELLLQNNAHVDLNERIAKSALDKAQANGNSVKCLKIVVRTKTIRFFFSFLKGNIKIAQGLLKAAEVHPESKDCYIEL